MKKKDKGEKEGFREARKRRMRLGGGGKECNMKGKKEMMKRGKNQGKGQKKRNE